MSAFLRDVIALQVVLQSAVYTLEAVHRWSPEFDSPQTGLAALSYLRQDKIMSATSVPNNEASPYQQSVEAVLASLHTDAHRGLTRVEAKARLQRHGRNELTAEKPVPAWEKFLGQFQDMLVILLLIAMAISAALWMFERESALPYEAIAIFAVVLLNTSKAPSADSFKIAGCGARLACRWRSNSW